MHNNFNNATNILNEFVHRFGVPCSLHFEGSGEYKLVVYRRREGRWDMSLEKVGEIIKWARDRNLQVKDGDVGVVIH